MTKTKKSLKCSSFSVLYLVTILILTSAFPLPAENTIKIGTLLSLTGDLAAYGKPIRNGAILAVDVINKNGGILGKRLELVSSDSQTEATAAVDAAQKLVDIDQVPVIIGALSSSVTIPVATSVTINKGVVLISPASTSPEITTIKDHNYLFRTVPSDALQCRVLAKVARERGFKTISIIYINNSYGEGLAAAMKASYEMLGGKVLASIAFSQGATTYRSEIQKAVQSDPDALLVIAYPENGVKLVRQAIEYGLASKFLFTDGMKAPEVINNVGAKYLNGTYGTAPASSDSGLLKTFKETYKETFGGMPPKPYIDTCFDAVILSALAMEKGGAATGKTVSENLRAVANPEGEKVNFTQLGKALALIRAGKDINYEGVSGSVNLDEFGDITSGSYGVWKIQNGKIVDERVEIIE